MVPPGVLGWIWSCIAYLSEIPSLLPPLADGKRDGNDSYVTAPQLSLVSNWGAVGGEQVIGRSSSCGTQSV